MIIMASYELVSAKDRTKYVDAFCNLAARAREFDGCVHIAITADSVDPERIDSVEAWRDAEVLDEWRRQAKAPRTGRPKYSEVKRYEATVGGPSSGLGSPPTHSEQIADHGGSRPMLT